MSSFKKRVPSAQASLPAGCRLSAYNGQVLISTGVPSLDDILGGGLPVGTILLIQEDRQTSYGQLLLKYFLRQGIVAGDKCVVVSGDESPEAIVRSLMGIAGEESASSQVQQGVDSRDDDEERASSRRKKLGGAVDDEDSEQDRLKIAWRYSGFKKFESGVEARPQPVISSRVNKEASSVDQALKPSQIPFCEQFDLTTRISAKALESADTTLIDSGELMRNMNIGKDSGIDSDDSDADGEDASSGGTGRTDLYRNVLDKIRDTIIQGGFSTTLVKDPSASVPAPGAAGLAERHICRIGINSVASPSWRSKTPQDLYKFLHALRGLLRFSFGAAVITIPAHLYGTVDQRNPTDGSTTSPYIHRLEQLCDASVRIESFAGALTNASSAASDYHGLFHVHKVPVLNALIPSSTKLSVLLDGAAKGSGGPSGNGTNGGSSKGVNNLGFKVRRKRFAIETFHLPPEGGVGQRRTSAEPSSSSASLSDRKSATSSTSSSASSSSSTGGAGPSSGSLRKPGSNESNNSKSRSLGLGKSGGGKVDVHSVPGASGIARKMMGLPPVGVQGAVSSGCSTGGSDSASHQHAHGQGQGQGRAGTLNSTLLDF
ncbi:Elongator subunit elp4 [Dissophora ornata]|nr:Elongator subunit elp4 [Dissophora ornata]